MDKYPKSRLENTPLNNTYKCGDGKWIMVCCHEYERYFPYFMRIIGREDLIENAEYNTFAKGNERCREIVGIIADGFGRFERDELDRVLQENDIPHAIVANVYDLMDSQQAKDNLYFNTFDIGDQTFTECATPVKFGGVTLPPRERAPYLGEQSSQILRELGYREEQIAELMERGVVLEKHVHDPLEKQA